MTWMLAPAPAGGANAIPAWNLLILRRRLRKRPRTSYGDQYEFSGKERQSEQPEASSHGGGVAPILDAELAEDVGDMELDGARADVQLLGDLGIRVALTEKVEHLPLARGEIGRGW